MKQKLLILMLFVASSLGVCAADRLATLIVELKNGSTTAFFLKDRPQVKFSGTDLKVSSATGDVTFALADVKTFTYAKKDPSGVDEQVLDPAGVAFENNVLVISQLKANAIACVYAMDGKLVRQLRATRYGTYRLNLSELPSGLYLVKVENVTYKITKP